MPSPNPRLAEAIAEFHAAQLAEKISLFKWCQVYFSKYGYKNANSFYCTIGNKFRNVAPAKNEPPAPGQIGKTFMPYKTPNAYEGENNPRPAIRFSDNYIRDLIPVFNGKGRALTTANLAGLDGLLLELLDLRKKTETSLDSRNRGTPTRNSGLGSFQST